MCQVRASAVLIPEQTDLRIPDFWFAYSIRMSLLPEGCTVHGRTFSSCQLYWRHWIIRENEVVKNEVSAEAVIGKVSVIYCVFNIFEMPLLERILLSSYLFKDKRSCFVFVLHDDLVELVALNVIGCIHFNNTT